MSDYNPNLGKTFDIKLSEDLLNLAEQMAQNVHDVWAKTRFEQGWTYGKVRNDEKKEHPCLVSYEELPENEKVYDRKTSQETLKFIMRKGFEIKHCSNLKNANDAQINSELKDLLEQMAKNVHDVWAKTRFEQGWRHGKVRNDEKKEHPCLVSYEELSENDKVYDRKTSQETLKFIMEKGFEIKHCLNPELRELSEQIAEKFHKEYFFVSYGKLLGDEEDCTLYIIQQTLKFIKKNGFEIEYCLDSKNANEVQIINSELKALSKQMAKHVHDVWVKTHLDSGWKYGEDRNDEKKRASLLGSF